MSTAATTTSNSPLPHGLSEEKYKKALDFAKLASSTYDWNDTLIAAAGMGIFSGIDDIKQQDFSTPDYKKVPSSSFLSAQRLKEANRVGLDFVIYQHKETDELVIAFRGTEPLSVKDWVGDVRQVLGTSSQYETAVKCVKETAESSLETISLTGHSLGGGLATAAALATGFSAIVFDAAGVSDNTLENPELGLDVKNQSMIMNFNVVDCFVTDWNGKQDETTIGTVPGISCKQFGDIYWLESISERANFIGVPDFLLTVKTAKKFLAHAWAVYTYQLENRNFHKEEEKDSEPPRKRARVVTPARKE